MNRTKVIGYLALGMVAVALTAVLCVTLQQGKEAGEARKIKQMESRDRPRRARLRGRRGCRHAGGAPLTR